MSKGDERAFDEIYQRYGSKLAAYFTRKLKHDKEKGEDFMHDLFAKLIDRPELFDPNRSFKTWVYSVANNMCINRSEEHTSELQSRPHLVCRLLLEKKNKIK